jgi:hypothetical protein
MGDCKMMRRVFVLIGAVIGMAAASPAVADPRDSVDRGSRLDTDALRDDVGTNRLQVPSHPLVIAPTPQPAPVAEKKKKSSASGESNR